MHSRAARGAVKVAAELPKAEVAAGAVGVEAAERSALAAAHRVHLRCPVLDRDNVPHRVASAPVLNLALCHNRAGLIAPPDVGPDRPLVEVDLAPMSVHVLMQAVARAEVALGPIT